MKLTLLLEKGRMETGIKRRHKKNEKKGDSTSQLELGVRPVGIMHAGTWEFAFRGELVVPYLLPV